jgi:hypothetical protein
VLLNGLHAEPVATAFCVTCAGAVFSGKLATEAIIDDLAAGRTSGSSSSSSSQKQPALAAAGLVAAAALAAAGTASALVL